MYTLIRSYYLSGRWNDTQLDAAVARGMITTEQAEQIRADKAAQDAATAEAAFEELSTVIAE